MTNKGRGRFGRRTVLGFLLFGTAQAALGAPPVRSPRPLAKPGDAAKHAAPAASNLISKANLGGKISFAVADAKTGEILESHNPVLGHPPASTAKALTALYATQTLGPDYRFATRLIATGPVEDGLLKGDLVLCGGGNPTLDSKDLYDMAAALKEAGITAISGELHVFDAALPKLKLIDEGQPDHVSYNPSVSGLNLNFNRVFLEWKRTGENYAITMEARAETLRPGVGFARTKVVDRSAPVFSYDSIGDQDLWEVARGALGREGGRWLPVRHPRIYAGEVFQTVARAQGLQLPYPKVIDALPQGEVLVDHQSAELQEICKGMLKFSTNLTAEVLGMMATRKRGKEVGLPASGFAMSDWMRDNHGARKPALVDHSGLGDKSELTAIDMVKSLTGEGSEVILRPLLKPVVLARREGDRQIDATLQVVAKTGTLNFVSGLAGYITTPGGRDLAFAVFMSDVARRSTIPRAQRERPRGAKGWNGRAKRLQRELLRRWFIAHEV